MTTTDAKTVLILGGGIGGVATANRLRHKLGKQHRVILINREADFSFAASYLWVMNGTRKPSQVTRPLVRLERRGIEVIIGTVENIDPVARTVTVSGNELAGDFLVVSLGADWATDKVPGLLTHGHTFATLPGAQLLRAALDKFSEGQLTIVTAAPLYKCPAAPYEAALLIDAGLRGRGARDRVQIAVRSAEPAPMPVAGAHVSAAVQGILAARGIDYQGGRQITAVEPGKLSFGEEQESTDLLVYMPPIQAPRVIADSALAEGDGWIHADSSTLETGFDGVYAIGDNTHIVLGIGKPLPRAGVFAHGQALAVADSIVAKITGEARGGIFDGHGACFIETGNGRAAYGSGNFYAEPAPAIDMKQPSRRWHIGKAAFEFNVMRRWL
ncbi:MAG: FAD-dependent oxidoreductase [Actinomycetota bacterium]|nr:FAD-dependent oxidoreductase [Actinomycetota bacterium]